jgi:hypothetical protein
MITKKETTDKMGKYLVPSIAFYQVAPEGDVERHFCKYVNKRCELFVNKYVDAGLLRRKIKIDDKVELSTLHNLLNEVEFSGRKIYLIVDECDAFMNRLLYIVDTTMPDLGQDDYKKKVLSRDAMLRNWGNAIKQGTSDGLIARAFFTGVTPVACGVQ